ncbi:MAG TPA: class I SAM-dependent methyltransferase [bacterium]|nr:class I SAM-dependent methyltransferase [bacterium]HQJ66309.1 class I SAM-dependent methyltransferase [bacterium]
MPSSQPDNISTVVKWIVEIDPVSVLDVGVGFGKYGVLAREYTDIRHGRYHRQDWKVVIDGIEVFQPYYNPIWEIYDRIYSEDLVELLPHLKNYELILLCDVIEHLEKPIGLAVLAECRRMATRAVIVSTPLGYYPQEAMHGNKYERHRSEWTEKEFPGFTLRSENRCLSGLYWKAY